MFIKLILALLSLYMLLISLLYLACKFPDAVITFQSHFNWHSDSKKKEKYLKHPIFLGIVFVLKMYHFTYQINCPITSVLLKHILKREGNK